MLNGCKKIFKTYKKEIFAVILSSALWVCAFPSIGLWPLAFVAIVPLLFVLDGASLKKAFWLTFFTTFFAYAGLVYWLVYTINFYGHIPLPIAVIVFILLLVVLAALRGFFFATPYAWMQKSASAYVLVPPLWVGADYFQTLFFGGFPWEFFGYAPYKFLPIIQAADILGVWLLTFIFVLVNASIYELFRANARWIRRTTGVALSILSIIALFIYGQIRLGQQTNLMSKSKGIKVAVVQGNIPQDVKWSKSFRKWALLRHENLSKAASAEGAKLIIWAETAIPIFQDVAEPLYHSLSKVVAEIDRYVLTGLPTKRFEGTEEIHHNSAYLINPEGEPVDLYHKNHLVPFGEFIPFKSILKKIAGPLVRGTGDFVSGKNLKVLKHPELGNIAVIICYEAIYPDLTRRLTRQNAVLLVNITNDAWFGKTSAPYQHLSMAAMRAVETRLYLARAANTGISAFVEPTGRIIKQTGLYELAYEVEDLKLINVETFYERVGDVLPISCLIFTALVLAIISLQKLGIKII